jgi:hypothetical protein
MFAALLLACGLIGLQFALLIPLWEAPDAIWHFAFIQHFAAGGGLPDRADAGLSAPWRQEGSQPPLYYLLAAPLVARVGDADADAVIRFNPHAAVGLVDPGGNPNRMVHSAAENRPWRGTVLAARLVNVLGLLWGALALWGTWRAATELFPGRQSVALLATAIQGLGPQFLFMAGSTSNDIAAAAAGSLLLWRALALLRRGPDFRRGAWLGLVLAMALLTKLSGLWLLPVAVAALWGAGAAVERTGPDDAELERDVWRRGSWQAALSCTLVAAVLAGWWYLRNWLRFGDPTGLPLMLGIILPRPQPPDGARLLTELAAVWRSYWAVFGWFNLPAPDWLYRCFDLLCLGGLVGLALRWRALGRLARRGLALAGLLFLLNLAGVIAWARLQYPQGRLLLPAGGALSLLLAVGLVGGLAEASGRRWAWGLAVLLGLTSLALLHGRILPAYRPDPPRRVSEAAETAPHVPVFGGRLALTGVGSLPEPETDREGLLLPPAPGRSWGRLGAGSALDVALEWQALTPIDRDYSVFLHLVDEHGLIIAQRDSLPQGGRAATRDWLPDPTLRYPDHQRLDYPVTRASRCHCALRLGVYDAATGTRLTLADGTDHVDLGWVDLEPAPAGGGPAPLAIDFGRAIRLAGFDLPRRQASPGGSLAVTLTWQALLPPDRDYKVGLQLRDAGGRILAQRDEQPGDGERSTGDWRGGERVVDAHRIDVPADAPPGEAVLYLLLYDREHPSERLLIDGRDPELSLGPVAIGPGPSP